MVRPRKPGSGGPRVGTPGTAYSNRSDLRGTQGIKTATGQPYGAAQDQAAAQKAIPLPQQPGPPPGGVSSSTAPPGSGGPSIQPGGLGELHAPTNRPNEPLTAGLPTGAGPGPEALNTAQDPTLAFLRGVYAKYPSPDLLTLINEAIGRGMK